MSTIIAVLFLTAPSSSAIVGCESSYTVEVGSATEEKCTKCRSGYFLAEELCFTCSELIPNCNSCTADFKCTDCSGFYSLTSTKTSTGKTIQECEYDDRFYNWIGIAVVTFGPLLLTILLTYCIMDICFGCKYTLKHCCCKTVNFNEVVPQKAKNYSDRKIEVPYDEPSKVEDNKI